MGMARTAAAYEPIICRDSNHRGDTHPWLTIPRYYSIYPSILISVRIAIAVIITIAIVFTIHGNLSSKINLETTHTHIRLGTWHPFFRLDLITFSWPDLDSIKKTSNNQPSTLFKKKTELRDLLLYITSGHYEPLTTFWINFLTWQKKNCVWSHNKPPPPQHQTTISQTAVGKNK